MVTEQKTGAAAMTCGKHKNPLINDLVKNPLLYVMLIPMLVYYIIFCYGPMYGAIIAFKDFTPGKGNFNETHGRPTADSDILLIFLQWDRFFKRVFGNTVVLSLGLIVFSFPAPILFAILLNEVKNVLF